MFVSKMWFSIVIPGLYLIQEKKYSAGLLILLLWINSLVNLFVNGSHFNLSNNFGMIVMWALSGMLMYLSKRKKLGIFVDAIERMASLFFYILFLFMPIAAIAEFIVKPSLDFSEHINTAIIWIIHSLAISTLLIVQYYKDFYYNGAVEESYHGKGASLFTYMHSVSRWFVHVFNIKPPFKKNFLSSMKLAVIYGIIFWVLLSLGGIVMSMYSIDLFGIGFRR